MPCCEGSRHTRKFSQLFFFIKKYSKEPNSRKASEIIVSLFAAILFASAVRTEKQSGKEKRTLVRSQ